MRKLGLVALGLSLLSLAGTSATQAQDFPNKPITILVGYAAGGNIDVTARTIGQAMSTVLGQPFVIDNRPGAAGLIAQTAVAKAKPDGYTLVLAGTTGFVLAPRLVGTPPYTVEDFAGIGSVSETPLVLEVPANSRFKNFAEFASYAKANPEAVRIGHAGNGTTNHIAILRMQQMLGAKFTAVPYKGSSPAIADLLGNNIDAVVDQIPSSIGQLHAGAFKPLAVTSQKRAADLPQSPGARRRSTSLASKASRSSPARACSRPPRRHRPRSRSWATRCRRCSTIPRSRPSCAASAPRAAR